MKLTARRVAAFIFVILVALFLIALFVPGNINASAKSRQKSTMADIREIANAVEQFALDREYYPAAGSFRELTSLLEPEYIQTLKTKDRWDHDFHYIAWKSKNELSGPDHYVIASAGEDGKLENEDLRTYTEGITPSFSSDIVFRSGYFIRRPEGTER